MNNPLKLFLSLLLPILAGFIGSLATTSAIPTWYALINKPFFSPPNWIFAPVWTTLYLLMGISFFLIWKLGTQNLAVKQSLTLFLVHLILNALWSILFFGLHSPLLGLIDIIALIILLLIVIKKFYRFSRPAAYLLVPYLVWVAFATCLNAAIWYLN